MTDEEARALGEQLMALPAWTGWTPGMVNMDDHVVASFGYYDEGPIMAVPHERDDGPWCHVSLPRPGNTPDLRHPATLGCVLAMVREATGDSWAYVSGRKNSTQWFVRGLFSCPIYGAGPTEAHALVSALAGMEARK